MKLLVQSDDYGITRAVSLGCIHGIRNGVVRNTGIFANMPYRRQDSKILTEVFLDSLCFGRRLYYY